MRRLVCAAALCAMIAALPASAEPSSGERAEIQNAISGQIEAFKRDDGSAAYAFAADQIKQMFPSPEAFLDMVKRGYPAVYRPRSVVFGSVADGPAGPVQQVLITDTDGVSWVASYSLAKAADGSWRIIGCSLTKNQSDAI